MLNLKWMLRRTLLIPKTGVLLEVGGRMIGHFDSVDKAIRIGCQQSGGKPFTLYGEEIWKDAIPWPDNKDTSRH